MQFFVWANQLAWLLLNLSILAVIKLRWPDSVVGQTLSAIA